jgi:hypothetical protein
MLRPEDAVEKEFSEPKIGKMLKITETSMLFREFSIRGVNSIHPLLVSRLSHTCGETSLVIHTAIPCSYCAFWEAILWYKSGVKYTAAV